jgi:hypothetical protein
MESSAMYTLFCVVEGESTSNAFPVEIEPTKSIGSLKDAIKTKKSPRFNDIAADKLKLYKVSIPVVATRREDEITLDPQSKSKGELSPVTRISKVFAEEPPEETIHIIVQRSGNATYYSMQYYTFDETNSNNHMIPSCLLLTLKM